MFERWSDVRCIVALQHKVRGLPGAVAQHQDRHLLIRQATFGGAPAAAARRDAGHRWGTLGYLVAEVFSGADDIAAQALGGEADPTLDAAFDFPLRWATVGVLAAEENGLSRRPASTLDEPWAYGAHSGTYRDGAVLNMMLGNHDFVRFGVPARQRWRVDLEFSHAEGDIDAVLFEAGEEIEWELLERGELHLVRKHPATPRTTRRAGPKKS